MRLVLQDSGWAGQIGRWCVGFKPVFQLLATPGENRCSMQNPPMSGCVRAARGSGQREVHTRMLGDVCRKSGSVAARGVGTGASPGIKTFPRPPRLALSTGGRGNAHPQRGSSPTGEAGSQVLCPGPATHRLLAADGQNTEPRPRLKITEVRLVCMSRAPHRREASVKPLYGFFWWIRKNTFTLETFCISQLYKTELCLMLKTP